jgi:hypothetical protein
MRAPESATLPDDSVIAATALALQDHGIGVEIVDDLEAARDTVLARIPRGASVLANASVTLQKAGIAEVVANGGRYESARSTGRPEFALGSVQAITRDGTLVIASASGRKLAAYAWGAGKVIFVVGAQKLVLDAESARKRLSEARADTAGARERRVGKILEIHQEDAGRIHVVLIRSFVGS